MSENLTVREMRTGELLTNVIEELHKKASECIEQINEINDYLFGDVSEKPLKSEEQKEDSGLINYYASQLHELYGKLEMVQIGLNKLRTSF